MEQPGKASTNNGSRILPIKVFECGKRVEMNNSGKSLCILARDYKGFGNQGMNGVAEEYEANNEDSGSHEKRIL